MIYFIVGHKGVGKTFLFDRMGKDSDFCAYDTGPIVRNFYKKDKSLSNFADWVKFHEEQYGENIFPRKIAEYILSSQKRNKIIVVFGNRKLSAIQEIAHILGDNFSIIYLDAPNRLLRQNFQNREKILISTQAWTKLMSEENKYGLKQIKDYVQKNSKNNFLYRKYRNDRFLCINIMYFLKLHSHKLSLPKFLYYTTNPHKISEAKQILDNQYHLDFDLPSQLIDAPEIQSSTCTDVAAFTAKYLADKLNVPILKSDSGLYLDCLGGLPGPYSAYFAKQIGEEKLLKLLTKESNRKATIEHCFAYCEPNSDPIVFSGRSSGRISNFLDPHGVWLERFFIPQHFNKTLGELALINYQREIECWGDAIHQFAIWYLQNKGIKI